MPLVVLPKKSQKNGLSLFCVFWKFALHYQALYNELEQEKSPDMQCYECY